MDSDYNDFPCYTEKEHQLYTALKESIKLQAHYGKLLNQYDGGKRFIFKSPEQFIARLEELAQKKGGVE